MKTVRWVGHPSPFEHPQVQRRLITNSLRQEDLLQLRWIDEIRISAGVGRSAFRVGIEHGFSRLYEFGPHIFEQQMDDADVELLLRTPWDRAMFEVDGRNQAPPDWFEHAPANIQAKKPAFLRREYQRIPVGR